jgi:colanic acid/amylovoran biosynthesis glycosyltransferase
MVCVARLDPKKGLDVAIEACAKLRDAKVEFLFQIIGDGPEKTRLEQQVHQLELEDYVVLLGPKTNDELVSFFREACVFLMPCVKTQDGNMDGIPVAMMEAMACQVPVVSTIISGIPELVEDGVTGRLVHEREVDALTEVLKELLGDMDQIGRLGKAAREHVLKGFSVYENAAKLRKLIET